MSGRSYAADEFDTIRTRVAQIKEEETLRCPQTPSRTLHECLRSSSRCNASCPNHLDWLGSEGTVVDHNDCCD